MWNAFSRGGRHAALPGVDIPEALMEERAGAGAPLSAQSKKETWWSVADCRRRGLKT